MSKFSSALRAESLPAAEGGRWRGIFTSRRLAGRVRCLTTFSSLDLGSKSRSRLDSEFLASRGRASPQTRRARVQAVQRRTAAAGSGPCAEAAAV